MLLSYHTIQSICLLSKYHFNELHIIACMIKSRNDGFNFSTQVIVEWCDAWMVNFYALLKFQLDDMDTFPDKLTSHIHCANFSHPTEWLDALSTDNVETATTILQAWYANYKDFLMNGDIPSPHRHLRNISRSNMEFCITKPLHSAAIFHSHAMLWLLYESGDDVLQVDNWQNNVVHM